MKSFVILFFIVNRGRTRIAFPTVLAVKVTREISNRKNLTVISRLRYTTVSLITRKFLENDVESCYENIYKIHEFLTK